MTSGRSVRLGEAVFGLALLAIGILIAVETMLMPSTGRGAFGPALFPYLVSGGLALIAVALLREALKGRTAHGEGIELDGVAAGVVAGGLVAQFLLIEWIGWVPAATLLFMAVARAFGERRVLRNAALGLLLAGTTFVLFTYALDLTLPSGAIVERLFPGQ